jgi:hypothetical protein
VEAGQVVGLKDSSCFGLVSWSGGLVAVGGGDGSGRLWTSDDGKAWTSSSIGGSTSLNDVAVTDDGLAGIFQLADGRWLGAGDTFDPPEPGIATWIGTADGRRGRHHVGDGRTTSIDPDGRRQPALGAVSASSQSSRDLT